MDSTIEFKSLYNNCYLYDFNTNLGMLINPEFVEMIKNKSNLDSNNSYYYKKYIFLKNHGLFKQYAFDKNISRTLTENDIINQIANTEQLTFEVTENCNLNCLYCGYGGLYAHKKRRNKYKLTFETAKSIIDYCMLYWNSDKNKSIQRVIYIGFYGGEPLLNFELIKQIVDYVKKIDCYNRVQFAMTTNSLLLNKYLDFLVQNKFHLLLSLDGGSSNNIYRKKWNGENSFQDVDKNINSLFQKYPDYFTRYVNFNAVLHNANSVEEIFSYFKEKYNKIPQISELNTYGIEEGKKSDFKKLFVNYEDNIIASDKSSYLVTNLFISIPLVKDLSRFVLNYFPLKKKLYDLIKRTNITYTPTGTCIPFSKKIFVSAIGELYPCEVIHRDIPLGQIVDGKLSLNYTYIKDVYNKKYLFIRKQCNKCYYQKSCVQCIFNMPQNNKNEIHCEHLMNKTNFKKYLAKKISVLEKNNVFLRRIFNDIVIE